MQILCKCHLPTAWIGLLLVGLFTTQGFAIDTKDTRMLAQPAISADRIAFVYAEDLWICRLDGSGLKRLTTHPGIETAPCFSPDGQWIAFSAQYNGNIDVYLVAAEGGVPKRLTWHPGPDEVQDFSRDGGSVLFTSPRAVHTTRFLQLFEISVEGGHPVSLPIPCAARGAYSPEGDRIAYVPLYPAYIQWKNYRGGTTSRIWLYDRADHSVEQIPQPEGRCNDTDPMWRGDRVYFRSDREGEFNLFCFDQSTKKIEQLTHYADFPILSASIGPDYIAYEQAGYLYLFDLHDRSSIRLKIGVAADLIETMPRFVSGGRYVRSSGISPSGSRAVFGYRGEIVTVPAKKGDARNLTLTPGVHEQSPAWSPDGKSIAFLSDASGEYELHIAPQDGKGEVKKILLKGAGFFERLTWSPDGKKLTYSDNAWTLYWIDLETEEIHEISKEPLYGPNKTQSWSWSPDSMWIAFTRTTETYFQQVFLYSIEEKESYPVTDGLSDVGSPAFDAGGKYLYMAASTDAGPVRGWFAMSNADMELTNSLYLAVLSADEPSPLKRESDEEEGATDSKDDQEVGEDGEEEGIDEAAEDNEESEADDGKAKPDKAKLKIDFEGMAQRIVAMPTGSGYYRNLRAGKENKLYYLKSERYRPRFFDPAERPDLYCFDLKERKEEKIASGIVRFSLTPKGDKFLLAMGRDDFSIVDAGPKLDLSKGKLNLEAVQVKIDPPAEWEQIYHEAWRINRDYFYDPGMHGADWPAMREKYSVFLPHLAVRSDLNRVIQWLCSELAVGHHRVRGGDRMNELDDLPGGLLGADYTIHEGRYRFEKIYGGLNWNPELRAPLTEPGVNVKEGEYLLAVEGVALFAPENLYSRFENKAGKTVEITVGPGPDGEGSRTVKVEPIRSEEALRNRDWVEGNLKKVDEATNGRVAYVYVPNTTTRGHTYFKRYFFPQTHKEAIIIDERYNGGGQVADYYIDLLRRPDTLCCWATRYGMDIRTPFSSIQGPKVMIIDETAGSGGDLLPWMFHKLKLGPLIGRRTWGGLVGVLGFPVLMDGGRVTAPNLAIWTEDGFIVENVGVPPDIEVEQWPEAVIKGHDPQLEKAIEVVMKELEAQTYKKPERPDFPVRVRKQE